MPLRTFRPITLALGALLAACGSSSASPPSPGVPSGSPVADKPPASAVLPASSASAPAPAASASSSAPDAPALPSADPLPLRTAAPAASASASASVVPAGTGAPKARDARDAGAPDAGAVAAVDAGAAVSPGLQIAREVDAIFVGKKTFSARFKQQYTQKVTGTVKDSSGTVLVERPSKISFHYDPPSKNRIVSDGTTIRVYVAEDSQMFETPVQKTQYPGALAFMMGNGIASSFDFAINPRAKFDGVVLDGKPLAPNPSYDTVMFFIDRGLLASRDPGVIRRVLIVDAQGNKNRFDFEGASQPATIDPAEFTFTPPPGTSIRR